MQKDNMVAVLAVFVVEFSYGLAAPFMELSVGKRWWQPPRGLSASRPEGKPQRNTGRYEARSELASERYKKQRSERSELGSERYKKQRSAA